MKLLTILIFILLLAIFGLAQRTEPASKTELAEITDRGRQLFEYDVAAWQSTDAVMALSPTEGSIARYIAQKTSSGWVVGYGKLNENKDKFLVSFEASQGATPKEFKVMKFDAAKQDTGFYLFAARAIETAMTDFPGATRPYNVAVLPAASNQLFVYLLPAQTKHGVFPLGGDVRYLISNDGLEIKSKRQLHKSIIEFAVPEGQVPESGYHTAILDDVPEDTDVFHVLTRQPSIPELILTNKYVYRIAADGAATYLMAREAFTKIGK